MTSRLIGTFLILLLNINLDIGVYRQDVSKDKKFFCIQRLLNPFCYEQSIYFICELSPYTDMYLKHKHRLKFLKVSIKTRVSTNWTYFLTILHHTSRMKTVNYLLPDIFNVIQTHYPVCYSSQFTKPIVI